MHADRHAARHALQCAPVRLLHVLERDDALDLAGRVAVVLQLRKAEERLVAHQLRARLADVAQLVARRLDLGENLAVLVALLRGALDDGHLAEALTRRKASDVVVNGGRRVGGCDGRTARHERVVNLGGIGKSG